MINKLGDIGLSNSQVQENREKYGSNKLTEKKQEGFWKKYFGAFNDPIIKILMVALVINVLFVFTGNAEWYEAVGIFVAVLIATFVSTICEYSNEKAFAKLQAEAETIKCKVYRNGQLVEVSIDELVVGDYIELQAGDKVPVDGVMEQGTIKVNQATLNGEAEDVTKETPSSELEFGQEDDLFALDRVYRGTTVTEGECIIKAAKVGDNTILGKLAQEIQEEDERETPLKVKLNKLANQISKFGYIGAFLIAFAYMFMQIHNAGITNYFTSWQTPVQDLVNAVILAVIIIVMAVPEGLPLMIALVSGLNMKKMLKDNVLVRKINGIETAGSLNILFSDKTGTITKGQLEVVEFISGNGTEFKNITELPTPLLREMTNNIILNSNAEIVTTNNETKVIGGNGTERALANYIANSKDFIESALSRDFNTIKTREIVEKLPFNSANKYSAVTSVYSEDEINENSFHTFVKGAPEKIIGKCTRYLSTNGRVSKLTDTDSLFNIINNRASKSMRMLALAIDNKRLYKGQLESEDLILVGLVAIRDEVRPEAIEAINEVQKAGVQVVMITGDIKETAVAIAKDAGIIKSDKDIVLTSSELQDISDSDLKTMLPNIRVIARALPSDKSRLVKVAQSLNLVVGMTGDGVNDSPALKKADIGFAMGSGTEVAKEAGEIVILDDNFKSIEKAILFGRTIYNNIRMFIMFQLTINVSAVFISFLAPLLNITTPLTIIQILYINLIMDTLAALAFGGIAPLKEYMREKPKARTESIVSGYMFKNICTNGLLITLISLLFLKTNLFTPLFRQSEGNLVFLTGYFTSYIFMILVNAFNIRTKHLNIFNGLFKDKSFLSIIGSITLVQILFVFIGGNIMRTTPLTLTEWLVPIGLGLLVLLVGIVVKALTRERN